MTTACLLVMGLGMLPTEPAPGIFSPTDCAAVQEYWAKPGRWHAEPSDPAAPHKAVFTPAGSQWLLDYYHRRDPYQAVMPDREPTAKNNQQKSWDDWIDRRLSADKAWATSQAAFADKGVTDMVASTSPAVSPVPHSLQTLAGEPPAFYSVVTPLRHKVSIDGSDYTLEESVQVRAKFPYFRSALGVSVKGSTVTASGLQTMLARAGVRPALRKAVQEVSHLEGSFSSVNTYDTGGISVGWLQFAALETGRGSLVSVLANTKARDPKGFKLYFRSKGIDTAPDGRLVAVNLVTGTEVAGSDAVKTIVADKRLTAVFLNAGEKFSAFQQEQVDCLSDQYDPGALTFTATGPFGSVTGRVSQVIKSEAGLATLLDRLVNRGSIEPFSRVASDVMTELRLKSITDLAAAEWLLIDKLTYRQSFLASSSLGQPPKLKGALANAKVMSGDLSASVAPPLDPRSLGMEIPDLTKPKPEATTATGNKPSGEKPPVKNQTDPATAAVKPETGTPKQQSGPITAAGG